MYLNGNEWAKQQAAQHGIAFKPLDNGFAACADETALAGICASLSAADVWAFFDRWQAMLPSPLSAEDRQRGYGYLARVPAARDLRHPRIRSPRRWPRMFERTLPDQLTLDAPTKSRLVRPPRLPPDARRFHTRIINSGVQTAIQVHYRASKVKQYFKEAARSDQTTVNDTHDFGVGRMLTDANWTR